MSNVKWTDEQAAALDHKDGGAIVSASAGSGKTAVLVERVLRLLISGQAQPSGLAVVTFTEKAAQELKYRLILKLKEQINLRPQDAQLLRRRAAELHNARISTISSFCIRLLREYSDLTELSPGFTIMDENRADIMKGAVLDGLLEEFYSTADQNTLDLVGEYFIRKDDRTLYELISKAYSFCVNMPDYEKWLDICEYGFSDTVKKNIAEAAANKADEALSHYEIMKALLPEQSDKQQKYFDKLESSKALAVTRLKESGGVISEEISALFSTRINRVNDCGGEYAAARDRFLELGELALSLAKTAKNADVDTERYQPVQTLTVGLVREFISRYNAEKRAQNVADFADAEQQLYHLLVNHPEVKEKIGLQYIIVDEFQDSNEIQYEIFKRLSDNENNLYFVGDIKQSIYAFRGAQPEVFARICRDKRYTLYPLNANFRSRQNVIDGVNAIFDRIMTVKNGGADYRNTSRLVCSRSDGCGGDDMTEIISVLTTDDCDTHTAEADYVAMRIRDMIDSGYKVKGRPCREGDFAVLMRAKDRADIFADAMKRHGLSCEMSTGGGFFDSPEIRFMTAFLTILDDPYSDSELVTLMMSPIYGFNAEDMARIRTGTCGVTDISALRADCGEELSRYSAAYGEKPLYSCLIDAAKRGFSPDPDSYPALYAAKMSGKYGITDGGDKKCAALLAELKRLRGFMEGSTTSALIQKIYDSTNAKELLLICPDPAARAANLRTFLSLAKSSDEYGGLPSDFLKTLSDTAEHGAKIKSELSPAESGIKLMTVHGSKGLQFPICFISCCEKQFNISDEKNQFILSARYGISGKLVDRKHMLSRPTPAYTLAKQESFDKLFSEEIRLLYVAATRAEEKLIFTASAGRVYNNSYLGRLKAAAELDRAELPKGYTAGDVLCFDKKVKYSQIIHSYSLTAAYDTAGAPAIDRDTADRIAAQMTTPYPAAPLSRMAAKFSATELVRNRRITRGSTEHCDLYISRPKFAEKSGRLTGKRRGDAYHKAMQYIPLNRVPTIDELTAQLDALVEVLTEQERECIEPKDIMRFFDTEQARRMISSENIYREQPIFFKADVSKLSAKELGISERDREEYLALGSADAPYIQGIADAFFIEDGEIVLIDYKSDSFSDEEKLSEDYSFQLRLYAAALKRMYGMNVKESYIYSFRLGKMISVDMEESE